MLRTTQQLWQLVPRTVLMLPTKVNPCIGAEQLAARLNEKQYRRRCLMGLLQDQGVMAGMGNYLCCEALHVAAIHPQHRPADLSAAQLQRLTGSCPAPGPAIL